jgi:Icc-related predicted phosphoesterase
MGPRIAVSGHVHEPQAWRAKVGRTWSLNPLGPENNGAERPSYIVIDLEAGVAVLNRAAGANDSIKLS